jgi:predicted HicB family RNase H-like nuclease
MTTTRKKSKRARRPGDEQVWVRMLVRVHRAELERYRRAAMRAGLSVSEWVRSVLERASARR